MLSPIGVLLARKLERVHILTPTRRHALTPIRLLIPLCDLFLLRLPVSPTRLPRKHNYILFACYIFLQKDGRVR
jgi:hypothetical protein